MIIGVPKESKTQEYRVGLVPGGAKTLLQSGHRVVVQAGAGEGSGFADREYREVGAEVVLGAKPVYETAELIAKVKEPQPAELKRLRPGQILFCYLHLAPAPKLTRGLIERGVQAVALETIQLDDGTLPCLAPMSEIAGRMAVQVGAWCLMRENGGAGVLLGGVPGVAPAKVAILGAGQAGRNAARIALGMGAQVTVLDIAPARLAHLDEVFSGRLVTIMSDPHHLEVYVRDADLVIGAVLVPGSRAPVLVPAALVAQMRPGSVIVDIAVDQGGCIETTRPTTHDQPTFVAHGVIHYCVPNMPGAVARTSTLALTNATLPYLRKIADQGLDRALTEDASLRRGLNLYKPASETKSVVTCAPVAQAQDLHLWHYHRRQDRTKDLIHPVSGAARGRKS
jgi:alanine dehydrogenase